MIASAANAFVAAAIAAKGFVDNGATRERRLALLEF